jgi:hypothetical protein
VSQCVKWAEAKSEPVAFMAGRPFLHLLASYVRFHSANFGILRSAGDNVRMRWKIKYRYIFFVPYGENFFYFK